ncbi:MAG: hypothetical protein M1594_02605 [Candidatus Marsarchaeota archaeon]|nr:hypothetical protein [Candidatus Marsarchaeota archaeon]
MIKENLDTSIDRLVEYINANESVSVTNAAKVLAMNPDEVEKLGEMLAESGLISIRYELTNTILTSKKKIISKPTLTPQFKQLAVDEGKKIEKQIFDTESIFEFIESDLNKRINIAQNNLRKLSQQTNIDEKEMEKTESEMQKVIEEVHVMENRVNGLYKRIYVFDQQLQTFKDNIKKIEKRKPSIIEKIKSIFGIKKKIEVIPESEMEEADELKKKTKMLEKKIDGKPLQPLESKIIEGGKRAKIEIPIQEFKKIAENRKESKRQANKAESKTVEKKEARKIEKTAIEEKKLLKIHKRKKIKLRKEIKQRKTGEIKKTRHVEKEIKKRRVRIRILKFRRKGVWIKAWMKNGRFLKIKELRK